MKSHPAADARPNQLQQKSPTGSLPPAVPLAVTPTFRPWTHTSDDSYIYQLSLVVATATVSLSSRHSRFINLLEINPKQPVIWFSCTRLSCQRLFQGNVTRYGRPSSSPGTSKGSIKRIIFARAARFDKGCNLTNDRNRACGSYFACLGAFGQKWKRKPGITSAYDLNATYISRLRRC